MKKFTSVLILIVMLMCSVFVIAGCEDSDKTFQKDGVQYKKINGVYTINGYKGEAKEILDLSELNKDGVVIEAIGEKAFEGLKGVKTIIVPNTVKEIGAEAFCEMPDLEKLEVPFIGRTANGGNGEVRDTESAENKSTDLARTIYYWFCEKEYVGGATISGVKYNAVVEGETFFLPAKLETITLNSASGYVIPAYALYNNKIIKTLNINDNVKKVGVNALYGCDRLNSIKNGDNEYISLVDVKNESSQVIEIK